MYFQGVKKTIVTRPLPNHPTQFGDLHPLLQRLFLTRGITYIDELDRSLNKLPSPWLLLGMETMVAYLQSALTRQLRICIVADFDADGATSCAVAMQGLRLMGAQNLSFVVPNRFEYGYGLTPEIVELVKQQQADVIITVDNGISSLEGVAAAQAAGIAVLITDHHLPGHELPKAEAIVNPNLANDIFPSKAIAGVGVIFYVLMALRSRLREANWFAEQALPEPNLGRLLDYVALGTVADVVALDAVNRTLVYQGLMRIRGGNAHPGLLALIDAAGKNAETLTASDLGFSLGPRLNAAGRIDDMTLGIQCLLAEDSQTAKTIAVRLDALNNERRDIEGQMKFEAMALLEQSLALEKQHMPAGVCLYDASWHQGVIGILAARVKDRLHRPVICFAPAGKDLLKGSARSIAGLHIRDALSDVAVAHPKILDKFGGHAMAAGLTLKMHDYPAFALAFNEVVETRLAGVDLEQKVVVDGELTEQELGVDLAVQLEQAATWGQGFPEPMFSGVFEVVQVRVVGQRHLKWVLRKPGGHKLLDAIVFFVDAPEQWLGIRKIKAAYKLEINEYRGNRSLQLMLQYFEKMA
ncbi:single-stranded-DNA-specific exonuclease RecJ [Methylosoma difficile]